MKSINMEENMDTMTWKFRALVIKSLRILIEILIQRKQLEDELEYHVRELNYYIEELSRRG